MILYCTFEELSALAAGAHRVLSEADDAHVVVAAPPQIVADLEALTPRLTGDISITTLAEQRSVARATAYQFTHNSCNALTFSCHKLRATLAAFCAMAKSSAASSAAS